MIAITSCRALSKCAPEIAANQLLALESWQRVFEHIVIFGAPEPKLESDITTFISSEDWPTISQMMAFASLLDDWSCLINADIFVSQEFGGVEAELKRRNAKCAMSYRYEFVADNPLVGKRMDLGLDIFCARLEVWKQAAQAVPGVFRIGHGLWDNWTIGYFNTMFPDEFFDFTPAKVIFHPKHENRIHKYEFAKPDYGFPGSPFGPPKNKIY